MRMPHLLGPAGEAAMADVLRAAPLLAFDFDGTLAPIVARPQDARLSTALSRRLQWLAQRHPLAVVSGRCVADVAARLPPGVRQVVGNHGAEGLEPGDVDAWSGVLDAFRARLRERADALRSAGVEVEDKRCSIALHYRRAADVEGAARLAAALAATAGPGTRSFGGKRVLNVMAADAPDKGEAVVRLAQRLGCGSAVYFGDDVNDEPVFLRAPRHWLTVKVGRDGAHSAAAFFLDSPSEVGIALERLRVLSEGLEHEPLRENER